MQTQKVSVNEVDEGAGDPGRIQRHSFSVQG